MHTKRIIPCLDVNNGRVVKGVNFVSLRDAGDPVEIACENQKHKRNTKKQKKLRHNSNSNTRCNGSCQCAAGKPDGSKRRSKPFNDQKHCQNSQPYDWFHKTPPFYRLCLAASYISIPAAIAALRDSTFPHIGIRIRQSAASAASSVSPFPSFPIRKAVPP